MTNTPTDEGNNTPEPQENETQTEEEIIDDDPMVAEMKEAEAEIAALEEGKAKPEDETGETAEAPKGEEGKTEGEEEGGAKTETPEDDKGNENSLMIPKARFDKVLSERDLARSQRDHLSGRVNVLQDMVGDKPNNQTQNTDEEANDPGESKDGSVDKIDDAIKAAEDKKLELAAKYDEGDISTVDLRTQEIELDREIRELSDQRDEAKRQAIRDESKAHTDAAVSATKQENFINDQALAIQQNHPNISVIDQLPKATSDAVWANINNQAAQNLSQRGVNVQDNSPQIQVALMQEKAKLTDQLTPENTTKLLLGEFQFVDPSQYTPPQQQEEGQTTQTEEAKTTEKAETAKNRADKVDLANSQPPSIADMGKGTDTGELSEQDVENMSEDQIADMIQSGSPALARFLGNSN